MLKNENTPAEEVKNTDSGTVETKETEAKAEEPKVEQHKTVEEMLDDDKSDDRSVPLSTFLEIKKEKKELEKEINSIKEQAAKGASKTEINNDLKSLAEKYDVDSDFLSELSTIIYSKAKGEADAALEERLKPMQAKERMERINKVFNENFDKVMQELPEYEAVVNKDVIKELTLLPQNAKKTFQQIVEETYGKTVTGKKTMETSTPRGGKNVGLDNSRINDPEYFKQVMADPELKKQYNEGITNRINL